MSIKTAFSYIGMFSIAAQLVGGYSDVLAISEIARAVVTYWRATTTKLAQALLDLLPLQLPEGSAFILLTTIFMSMTVIGAERSPPRTSAQRLFAKPANIKPKRRWLTVLNTLYTMAMAGVLGYAAYNYGIDFLLFGLGVIISMSILWLRTRNHDASEQYFRVLGLYLILCVYLFKSDAPAHIIWLFYATAALLLPFATPTSLTQRFVGILKLTITILLVSRVGIVIPQIQAAFMAFVTA